MDDNQNELEQAKPEVLHSESIGSRLHAAREFANLSLEDVAAHLRLTCQLVQDIENNDYSHAKRHLVFIRGYLRSYAKLVDLSPDEIIDGFNAMQVEDVPIVKPSWQTEEAQELERAERSNWLAFILLSTFLLIGVGFWWYSQYYNSVSLTKYISNPLERRASAADAKNKIDLEKKNQLVAHKADGNPRELRRPYNRTDDFSDEHNSSYDAKKVSRLDSQSEAALKIESAADVADQVTANNVSQNTDKAGTALIRSKTNQPIEMARNSVIEHQLESQVKKAVSSKDAAKYEQFATQLTRLAIGAIAPSRYSHGDFGIE